MSADFIVRHGTREEAIRRHREIAARSYFPYHGRRPDGTGVDASPSSLTVRPVKQKGNAHHHNGNHDALEWPSRTIPSIHQHLAKADEEREQEQGTLVSNAEPNTSALVEWWPAG